MKLSVLAKKSTISVFLTICNSIKVFMCQFDRFKESNKYSFILMIQLLAANIKYASTQQKHINYVQKI